MVSIWIASTLSLLLVSYEKAMISGNFFNTNLISGLLDVTIVIFAGLLYHKTGISMLFRYFFLFCLFCGISMIISDSTNKTQLPIIILFVNGAVKVT